ncbi:MAG: hypothetical protein NZ750_09690 [Anaerolineae bacterium]|nr:hypothetical protein [Anaerolineae bacterium]MDW8171892.1 hypothetical protein [Anaerolineae bacterium]
MATGFGVRLRQGVRALLADLRPLDEELAARTLDAVQLALFRRMTRSEQLHSLNVLRDVLAQAAETPRDLAQAALLHDVGKTLCPLSVAQRSLAVVIATLWPALDRRWRGADPQAALEQLSTLPWWRVGSVVRYHHPAWGAQLAQSAGLSARALWLIAHHAEAIDDHPHAALLRRLQQADDRN